VSIQLTGSGVGSGSGADTSRAVGSTPFSSTRSPGPRIPRPWLPSNRCSRRRIRPHLLSGLPRFPRQSHPARWPGLAQQSALSIAMRITRTRSGAKMFREITSLSWA